MVFFLSALLFRQSTIFLIIVFLIFYTHKALLFKVNLVYKFFKQTISKRVVNNLIKSLLKMFLLDDIHQFVLHLDYEHPFLALLSLKLFLVLTRVIIWYVFDHFLSFLFNEHIQCGDDPRLRLFHALFFVHLTVI